MVVYSAGACVLLAEAWRPTRSPRSCVSSRRPSVAHQGREAPRLIPLGTMTTSSLAVAEVLAYRPTT